VLKLVEYVLFVLSVVKNTQQLRIRCTGKHQKSGVSTSSQHAILIALTFRPTLPHGRLYGRPEAYATVYYISKFNVQKH
jgi:hypothetical protein